MSAGAERRPIEWERVEGGWYARLGGTWRAFCAQEPGDDSCFVPSVLHMHTGTDVRLGPGRVLPLAKAKAWCEAVYRSEIGDAVHDAQKQLMESQR